MFFIHTFIFIEYQIILNINFPAEKQFVVYGFALTSITGPTLGVFFGGYIIDRQGGYTDDSGKCVVMALRTITIFGNFLFAPRFVVVTNHCIICMQVCWLHSQEFQPVSLVTSGS
jgi:hypothetical protein